jgi:thymidine phosphorylase
VEDDVDFTAGVWLHKKVGEAVEAGDTLCTLHTSVAAVRVCRVP